jgi:hypothetical protein
MTASADAPAAAVPVAISAIDIRIQANAIMIRPEEGRRDRTDMAAEEKTILVVGFIRVHLWWPSQRCLDHRKQQATVETTMMGI